MKIAIGVYFSLNVNAQTTLYVSLEVSGKGKGTIDKPFKDIESVLQKSMNYMGDDTVFIQLQSGFYALDKTIRIEETLSVVDNTGITMGNNLPGI